MVLTVLSAGTTINNYLMYLAARVLKPAHLLILEKISHRHTYNQGGTCI